MLAECILELERLARATESSTVGTVGEIEVNPSLINVIPERIRFSLDIRGVEEDELPRASPATSRRSRRRPARKRGLQVEYRERQNLAPTPLDERIVGALAGRRRGDRRAVHAHASGAAHDTMCVADHVPSAMVFVPCKDGISHSPLEDASPADAALAAEIILEAIRSLSE